MFCKKDILFAYTSKQMPFLVKVFFKKNTENSHAIVTPNKGLELVYPFHGQSPLMKKKAIKT